MRATKGNSYANVLKNRQAELGVKHAVSKKRLVTDSVIIAEDLNIAMSVTAVM